MFTVGVDLGQSQDYTAIAIVERLQGPPPSVAVFERGVLQPPQRPKPEYHLRYLRRPALGTPIP